MALPPLPKWVIMLPKALPCLCNLLPKRNECLLNHFGCPLPGNKHLQTGILKQYSSSFLSPGAAWPASLLHTEVLSRLQFWYLLESVAIERLRWLRICVPGHFCFNPTQAIGPRTDCRSEVASVPRHVSWRPLSSSYDVAAGFSPSKCGRESQDSVKWRWKVTLACNLMEVWIPHHFFSVYLIESSH